MKKELTTEDKVKESLLNMSDSKLLEKHGDIEKAKAACAGELKLLKDVFNNDYDFLEVMEMTSLFRVTDMDKFNDIVDHIHNNNGVLVMRTEDGKVSLMAHDIICDAIPLSVKKEDIKSYEGPDVSTLELLQEILPDGELILLQSSSYNTKTKEMDSSALRISNNEIRRI